MHNLANTTIGRAALIAAAGLATPLPAIAQTHNWSGFYAGLHAGAAWGDAKLSTTATCPSGVGVDAGYFCQNDVPASLPNAAHVGGLASGAGDSTAFNGGIQLGYNMQSGGLVLGGELDIGTFKLNGKHSGSAASYPYTGVYATTATQHTASSALETSWLATLRGRLGFATGNMLLYFTGGLALTDVDVSNRFADNNTTNGSPANAASSASKVKAGWALGVGGEWAFAPKWSLKAEYLHVDFGKVSTSARISRPLVGPVFTRDLAYTNGLNTSGDLSANIGRVGVNYKF